MSSTLKSSAIQSVVLPLTIGDGRSLSELQRAAGLEVFNGKGRGGGKAGGDLGSFIDENEGRVSKKLIDIEIELLYFGRDVTWAHVLSAFDHRKLVEPEPEDAFQTAIQYPQEPASRKYISFVNITNPLYVMNYLGSYFFPADLKRNAISLMRTKNGERVMHLMHYNPESSGASGVWFAGRRRR